MMKKGKKLSQLKKISPLLFVFYMIAVAYVMFFAESLGRTYTGSAYRYNLIPFQEIRRFYGMLQGDKWLRAMLNLAGNVVCFIPFGSFLPFLVDKCKRVTVTVLYTLIFSFLIEITQLLFQVGSFDIDDLILNTAGGLAGYMLYAFFRRIYIRWELRNEK